MSGPLVRILDGNTFVVSDDRGDIEASPTDPTGLFSFDTRFLSTWVLTVDGERLTALSTDDLQYFETRFFLVPGTGTVYVDAKLSVIRQRAVADGFREQLTILNHDDKPVDLTVRIEAGCDFADLFEVKDALAKKGTYYTRVEPGTAGARVRAGHLPPRDGSSPATHAGPGRRARADASPSTSSRTARGPPSCSVGPGMLGPDGRRLDPAAAAGRAAGHARRPGGLDRPGAATGVRLGAAAGDLPAQPGRPRRAAVLAAHRRRAQPARRRPAVVHDHVRPRQHPHQPAGAAVHAGAGRDDPAGARRVAGQPDRRLPRRGSRADPARDALRRDDRVRGAAALARTTAPPTPRRCSSSCSTSTSGGPATPSWSRELEHEARAALRWIDEYADLQGNGYISYQRRNERDRAGEPVLEGLLGLDLLPRRPPARLPARHLRAAGLRLRREDARRPAGPAVLERPRLRRPAGAARRPTSSAASTATSGSRTASTSRSRSTPTAARSTRCRPTSATCCGAASSTTTRRRPSPSTCSGRGCSPAGACAPSPRARSGTTRSATTSARSGRSTTRSSPGACAATASRRRPRAIAAGILDAAEFFDGRLPEAFGGYERDAHRSTRSSTRPRAARRPGPPARRCCSCAPCSGWSRSATTWSSTRRCRSGIGRIELLDIPGRWGRADAFGRERGVAEPPPRLRPQLGDK